MWLAPLAIIALLSAGCSAVVFAVANAPARWSKVRRVADLPYGNDARQKLDVYVPAGGAVRGRPVLVFFYGGSWDMGRRTQYRFVGTAMAELGYVTVVPDYRVYPEVKFPQFIDDGANAVAWTVKHAADYGADAQRIVLMGHSAGAHLAAMLAVDPQYLQRAGVERRRIAGLMALSGPHDLRPDTPALKAIFAPPYTAQDWQVIQRVTAPVPPALLLHGLKDRRVWPHASELLADQLRAAGGQVTLKLYPDCDHACTLAAVNILARRRASTLADIQSFLQGLAD